MSMRIIPLFLFIGIGLSLFGCSGGRDMPLEPGMPEANPSSVQAFSTSHNLWGFWQVSLNAEHNAAEIVPIRIAEAHFNVNNLLEYSPCINCLRIVNIQPSGSGYLEITIELRHPYPGVDTFTGFDVRGIAIFNGSAQFPATGLSYSENGLGDMELLNADGYTTLYNLSTEGHGMRGYLQGKMATSPPGDAELNGYKCFVSDENRRYFSAGDVLQVVYDIKLPAGPFVFGYAVDANWAPPNPFNDPDVPDDFPLAANSPEAWDISVSVTDLCASLNDTGTITVDVWDHQGMDTIDSVKVEAPEIWAGQVSVPVVGLVGDFIRFEGAVMNTGGVETGDYVALVAVRDTSADTAPEWMDITAYNIFSIHVGTGTTQPGIYVDGDYPGNDVGLPELGTTDAPFNTILEGVVASGPGDDIWVDPLQGGEKYMERVQMKDGMHIHGFNWNDDGDSGKPIVQGPDNAKQTFYGEDMDDILIEGFELHVPNNIYGSLLEVIFFDSSWEGHTTGAIIRDNYFTGYIDNPTGASGDEWELIKAYRMDDMIIENNIFANCHVTSESGGFLAAMWLSSCENPIIRYNRMYDNASCNSFAGIIVHYADTITIHNNEIGSWTRLGSYYIGMAWAINVVSDAVNCRIYQNEVHDFDPTPGRAEPAGILVRITGDNPGVWEVHNNLIYNMHARYPDELSNYTGYCRGIFFRLDNSNLHISKLEIANNTIYKQTSGFYNSGVHLEKNSGAVVDDLNIFNNIVVRQIGPDVMAQNDDTAAFRLDIGTAEDDIHFCLANELSHLTFSGFAEGVGFLDATDPLFTDPDNGDFTFPLTSPAELGSPYIVDWDDTGAPSENPGDTDTNSRSRMGCFGGPLGDWTPPSQG